MTTPAIDIFSTPSSSNRYVSILLLHCELGCKQSIISISAEYIGGGCLGVEFIRNVKRNYLCEVGRKIPYCCWGGEKSSVVCLHLLFAE